MAGILIVSDDLSGAADSAVAAAAAGRETLVVLGVSSPPGRAQVSAEVLAVDGDTRHLPPAEAAAETARVLRACYRPGQIVFKKLDSTLRGNIGAELRAVLEAVTANETNAEPAIAIVAPAFPAAGRSTQNGTQFLNGVPLERTDIWRREGLSGPAHIPEMLLSSGLRPAQVGLDTIRGGAPALSAVLRKLAAVHNALVCDAETEDDLRAIAVSAASLGRSTVWAGSAGLARCLFPLQPGQSAAAGAHRPTRQLPAIQRPILFVVGSAATLCRQQVRELSSEPDVASVVVSPEVLRAGPHAAAWEQYNASLSSALAAGDTILALGDAPEARRELRGEGRELSRALGQLVAPHAHTIGALVLTGGETARAVLQALQVEGLWLIGELEPGVPVSITADASLPVVTKAGAFGAEATLRRCRLALRSNRVLEKTR